MLYEPYDMFLIIIAIDERYIGITDCSAEFNKRISIRSAGFFEFNQEMRLTDIGIDWKSAIISNLNSKMEGAQIEEQ